MQEREQTGAGNARASRMQARTPLARIRRALADGLEPPSPGELGATIASLALSTGAELARITELALFDPPMLLRLLRTGNSLAYRTRSGDPVLSLSRAVTLLGYEQVREMALSLPRLDERIPDQDHRELLRFHYGQAGIAAILARRLLEARHAALAEQGAITAMLAHSGHILAALYAPQALVAALQAAPTQGVEAAARRALGASFDELTHEALLAWHLPPELGRLLHAANALRPREPQLAGDWLPLSIACASALTAALAQPDPGERQQALADVDLRFGRAIDLDAGRIRSLLVASSEEIGRIERMAAMPTGAAGGSQLFKAHFAEQAHRRLASPRRARRDIEHALLDSGTPEEALALLDAVTDSRSAPSAQLASALGTLDELGAARPLGLMPALAIALAGVHRAMGYTRVSYFARDDATGTYRPRLTIGTALEHLRNTVGMGTRSASILHAALEHGVDLHIGDTSAPNVRKRLPVWFDDAFPGTCSFLILPIRHGERASGFILADRDRVDADGPGSIELDRMRALRNRIANMQLAGTPDFG